MNVDIRKITEDDWVLVKDIRLKSLQDAPDAFGSTHKRELAFTEDQWRSRLVLSQKQLDCSLWVAFDGHDSIGLVSCVIESSSPKTATLYQMWTAPEHRGCGVGSALLNAARARVVELGGDTILLSVTTVNTDAIAVYEKYGFVSTGYVEPLRTGSLLVAQTMKLIVET